MDRRIVWLNLIPLLLFTGLTIAAAPPQCSRELNRLLRALQNEKTSNDTMLELIKRGNDPETRKCLEDRLPVLLSEYRPRNDGIPDFDWGSEAGVAAELKITEAATVLARRIDMQTSPRSGGAQGYNFSERAADHALIDIGPPAAPFVIEVLRHGNPLQREIAAHVLRYIGTAAAWQALGEDLPGEKDPKVRHRIQEALDSRR